METLIRGLIKQSMIEKNKNKTITYRSILENAQKIAKKTNDDVTDEMIITSTKNEIKQLEDLLKFCKIGTDRYNETNQKIVYCKEILPKMASEQEIMNYLIENQIGKNIGTCMKSLKAQFDANMDGKLAANIAKQYISMN